MKTYLTTLFDNNKLVVSLSLIKSSCGMQHGKAIKEHQNKSNRRAKKEGKIPLSMLLT